MFLIELAEWDRNGTAERMGSTEEIAHCRAQDSGSFSSAIWIETCNDWAYAKASGTFEGTMKANSEATCFEEMRSDDLKSRSRTRIVEVLKEFEAGLQSRNA